MKAYLEDDEKLSAEVLLKQLTDSCSAFCTDTYWQKGGTRPYQDSHYNWVS